MAPSEVLRRLDEIIRERSILEHPFYQAWEKGMLTTSQLATYARIYYAHVEAFPRYLESAITHAEDSHVRAELADNLADERGNPAPHDELWLDFAEGVGADRDEVKAAAPHAAATAMVSTFQELAQASLATGVAALYAYESQQPDVSRTKAHGLRTTKTVWPVDCPEGSRIYFAADTLALDELALFARAPAAPDARLVWHLVRDRDFEFLDTLQWVGTSRGVFLDLRICLNGTGGCGNEYLRFDGERWRAVTQPFARDLQARLPPDHRLHKGRWLDVATLTGIWPVAAPGDANCCPSLELPFSLRLVADALVLLDAGPLRPHQTP